MTIQTSTLRPGLLVSLKSSVTGNALYRRRDIELSTTEEGASTARWETERTIADPAEHEAALKARTKARSTISTVCVKSEFGLLCPESAEEEMTKAIEKARAIVAAFNKTAKCTRVQIFVIAGRVSPNDLEAVRAINSEVTELLAEMERGVTVADVAVIRDAAARAKGIAEMLSTEARIQAEIAIDAARRAARDIVKADGGPVEVDLRAIRAITEARTAFLDLDPVSEVAAPAVEQRMLDLDANSPAELE